VRIESPKQAMTKKKGNRILNARKRVVLRDGFESYN
jgi:hypothetical protein